MGDITCKGGKKVSSGLVMFPPGHARNTSADLGALLKQKNKMLGDLVFTDAAVGERFVSKLVAMKEATAADLQTIYEFDFGSMRSHGEGIDGPRPTTRRG